MQLSQICIRRPVFTVVLSLILMALGSIFFTKLQLRDTPNIAPPIITVESWYNGADALYMEEKVTKILEDAFKTSNNLEDMKSTSASGYSNITLSFKLDTDLNETLNDIRTKISEESTSLPEKMDLPVASKIDRDAWPTLWLSVNSTRHNSLELTNILENRIKPYFEKLASVGETKIFGADYYSMRIEPDDAKMNLHKLTPLELEKAIREQNQDFPAGTLKTDSKSYSLNLSGGLKKVEDFKNVIVKRNLDKSLVKLSDVANIELKSAEKNTYLRFDQKDSLALGLIKQSNSNLIALSDEARKLIPEIKNNLPPGVEIGISYDAALPVKASIRAVFFTIFESILLVGGVIYLFLGSLRLTLIPLIVIPISLISTFSVMYMLGFSINTFTLLAMILAIGLVVDDAIVMMENIFRHFKELKKDPLKAASDASSEISFAVLAMTITLAAVFLPVGFIDGLLGKVFVEFAWTLAFCVLFSGFVALTLTPMMTKRMIAGVSETKPNILLKFDVLMEKLSNNYISSLKIIFNHKKPFLGVCVASIIVLILSFMYTNKTFTPKEDNGILQVHFSGPEGSSVEDSLKTVKEAEKILEKHNDVEGYFVVIGWGGGESAMSFFPLKDWSMRSKSQEEIKDELNKAFSQIPGMSIFALSLQKMGGGDSSGKNINFSLSTSLEYSDLDKISKKFLEKMNENPAFKNAERDFKSSTPTIEIIVNREKAYRYGVSMESIGRTVQYLIAGRNVSDFRMKNKIYDVKLQYNDKDRKDTAVLSRINIKNTDNVILPLDSVADIVETVTVKEYKHYNNFRSISINAEQGENISLQDAVDEIEKIADSIIDKDSTKIEYTGEIKKMSDSSSDTIKIFLFALLFIFLVLSAQFESFGDALIILVVVPFSITGGVLALLLCGNSINMYSNIGLVTLIGLVTKNSIMLVEFANQLREQGEKVYESAIISAKLRLRPILMTSIATIFGSIPLVLASGAGAGARNSIGIVMVGGMLLGTLFTLFVIPTIYHTFKKDIIKTE